MEAEQVQQEIKKKEKH